MKKVFLKSFMMAATLMLSTEAQADIVCRGKPTEVIVDRYSYIEANFGFGYIYLCNLDSDVTVPYSAMKSCLVYALPSAGSTRFSSP